MFTGIVSDIGAVESLESRGDLRARIRCRFAPGSIALGASIACDGICLTVVERGPAGEGAWFEVDLSAETRARTSLRAAPSAWRVGSPVNLERALRLGDELGGHIVQGHVDGVAEIVAMTEEGDGTRVRLRAPDALARFLAPKGSVALNGVSLTVNEVDGSGFSVNIIPHTRSHTTWGAARPGDLVNLEIDTIARYVARLADFAAG